MRLPKNGAAIRIEQYCKRRKDRKKPKRREDSSCVFAYYLSRHLPSPRYRRKRKRAEVASAQARKKFCKSRQDDTAGKSSRERQAPVLYAAVRVRRRSYGVSRIPRSVAGRITGYRRSLPQPSSAAWCPRLLTRAEVKDLLTAAY